MGEPGDPATHLENRVGEPLANPYLYMASQIHAGLDGVARKLDAGPSADAPYEMIGGAAAEVARRGARRAAAQRCFRAGFGDAFVDYYRRASRTPRSNARDAETSGQSQGADDVTAWEHREYFDLA